MDKFDTLIFLNFQISNFFMGWQDKQIIRIRFRKLVGYKHVSISTNKLLLSMSCLCLLFWSDLVWILAGTSEWRWTNSMKSLFNMTSGSGFLWDINLFTQSTFEPLYLVIEMWWVCVHCLIGWSMSFLRNY